MSLAVFNSAAFLTDAQLAVAAGATVTVRRESDSGLAAIYSDRAGTVGITNPSAFGQANGQFTFYAAGLAGGYSVEVTSGAESFTLRNVAIGLAAELDASAYGGSLMNAATAAAARATLELTAATQAAQEAATDIIAPVTPGRQQFHASAAKGWVKSDFVGAVSLSYNVTSVTDNSIGDLTVNWGTDFSSANYAVACIVTTIDSSEVGVVPQLSGTSGVAAGTARLVFRRGDTGAVVDSENFTAVAFGDQA